MAEKTHIIVPDPDTVIVLRDPLIDFAVWSKPDKSSSSVDDSTVCDASSIHYTPLSSEFTTKRHVSQSAVYGGRVPPVTGTSTARAARSCTDAPFTADNADTDEDISKQVPVGGIHYHVSSAHLKLASKAMEIALTGNWSPSLRKEDGRYYVTVHDWDEVALLTLLNIIHLKYRRVTREPSIELLAKVAAVVDYYDCAEATAPYHNIWIEWARKKCPMPTTYCRELILWLCVSAVFRATDIFAAASHVAIHWSSDALLRTLDLPIPPRAVTLINQKRQQKIADLFAELDRMMKRLIAENFSCPYARPESFQCGSLLLGAMMKEMTAEKLLPQPQAPFAGMTLDGVRNAVRNFRSVSFHGGGFIFSKADNGCDLAFIMRALLKRHEQKYSMHLDLLYMRSL